jgi:uncharacterized protein
MTVPRFWREQPHRYRLMGTQCQVCQRTYFPPRSVCPSCRRESVGKVTPVRLSGRGKISTWTTVHQPADGFELQAPYVMALIEMEEGCRLLAQIVDVKPEAIKAGLKVTQCFRKIRQDGERGVIYYGFKFRPA